MVILLKNGSSPVGGFESNVTDLLKFCQSNNVSIKYIQNGDIVDKDPNPPTVGYDLLTKTWGPLTSNSTGGKHRRRNNKSHKKPKSTRRRRHRKNKKSRRY